ncbi:hypothetical protein [Herbiconiux daphne]|uniref:Uncharacterized protein n=1 Tax=Herbiconiux daphne TaxID=2970914 RepID=A0ABT2H1K9_9MICO|nr:hypothetical protein [Herbiconiux daphne]MCS5733821.1 hypothetical protein [Herbiconiux daphne]
MNAAFTDATPPEPLDDEVDVPPDAVKVTDYEPDDPDREAIIDELPVTTVTTDRGDLLEARDDDRALDDFDDPDAP